MTQPEREFSCWEVPLVLLVAFGNTILYSLGTMFGSESVPSFTTLSGNYLTYMITNETIILFMVAMFLDVRGWTVDDLHLGYNWRLTANGMGLAASSILVTTVIQHALKSLGIPSPSSILHYNPADWDLLPIIGISMVNPIFEETIVIGYIMGAFLAAGNPTRAVNMSVGIRLLYHLYQGTTGVITIVPMGLIFSYYYYKRRKLWPVIFAHGIMDFITLISM